MANKILMLGGFRAGKSSILASILYALEEKTDGGILTVEDKTDYTSIGNAAVKLDSKRREIIKYLKDKNHIVARDAKFLVDMNPTQDFSVYTLKTRVQGAADIDFQFRDVAGEYMEETHQKYNNLKTWVAESDVFIIAIDTPYMMENDEEVNQLYNRTKEITKALEEICNNIEDSELDKKLVIFCPVKCEKWVRENRNQDSQAELVVDKVKHTYRTLINKLLPNGVEMWIMPIQTVGGLDFAEMTDAYKYFKNPEDKVGTRCAYFDLSDTVRLEDGSTLKDFDGSNLERNDDSTRDGFEVPYAWYKLNEIKDYKPVFCEQPAYHIIRFLVKKELEMRKRQKEAIDKGPFWRKIISWLTDPPFGQYITRYQDAISTLEKGNKIKQSGDGFLKITEIVH